MKEPQTPAEGVMKTGDWGTTKTYHVDCDCGDNEHRHYIEIEADEYGFATLAVYTTVSTPYWKDKWTVPHTATGWIDTSFGYRVVSLFNGVWRRVALTWTVWTAGKIELEAHLFLKEQAAVNYAATIVDAVESTKALAEERKKK